MFQDPALTIVLQSLFLEVEDIPVHKNHDLGQS